MRFTGLSKLVSVYCSRRIVMSRMKVIMYWWSAWTSRGSEQYQLLWVGGRLWLQEIPTRTREARPPTIRKSRGKPASGNLRILMNLKWMGVEFQQRGLTYGIMIWRELVESGLAPRYHLHLVQQESPVFLWEYRCKYSTMHEILFLANEGMHDVQVCCL